MRAYTDGGSGRCLQQGCSFLLLETSAAASTVLASHNAHPPASTGNGPSESIIPDSQASTARAEDTVNREILARKNNAHARTEMARKYNDHHVQSSVVGKYVAGRISRLSRTAIDISCRIADIAGSKKTWVQASAHQK